MRFEKNVFKVYILAVIVLMFFIPKPGSAVSLNYNAFTTIAESWKHGELDYWNLVPVNEKNKFKPGDNIYLMTQIRSISVDHRYRVELFRGDELMWDYSTDWLNVGNGWEYSNFFPQYKNAQPGGYMFKSYIDIGNGFVDLSQASFLVEGSVEDYKYHHSNTALAWSYGQGKEYWNLDPVSSKSIFSRGDDIYSLTQVRDIYKDHQWKIELYRGDKMLWDYTTLQREVGLGWKYSNFTPVYYNAQPGNYNFKVYIKTGESFTFLGSSNFEVKGALEDPVFDHAKIASSWEYGSGDKYWDLMPRGEKTIFNSGEDVHLLAQVRNIFQNHRYRVELREGDELQWGYNTNWLEVGGGWDYSNFFPVYFNAQAGTYQFWYYLDTGNGFKLHGKKSFVVNPVEYKEYNRGVTIYNTADKNDFEYFYENGISTVRLMLMDGDLLLPSQDYDLANPQNEILPENIDKLNSILSLGRQYGIKVIVDVHEVPGLNRWFISEEKPKDTRIWEETSEGEQYRNLLVIIWDQLSELMKDSPVDSVVYELFNEPEPKTDIDPNENKGYLWYDLQDKLINVIRENNDSHLLVTSPAYSWRTESLAEWIPSETVLADGNLIASVHGYRPIQFSIQEEAWYGNVDYNSYPSLLNEEHYGETYWDYDMIDSLFANTIGDFYTKYGMQVYLAEFAVNREAPGAELWLLDMMNIMNKNYSDEIWGWSVHVWEEDQYARLNNLDYDWSRAGMNDFSADLAQLEAVLAGINNTEEILME